MTTHEIRKTFLAFFESKHHQIVSSAPMVIKNDPTLMFTNAGMNQFKDIFLGNSPKKYSRIANSQKCLRVSGKHNDLEEVGKDTYHHTMFEMLGNWSFGDYFKKEAIEWAWELLAEVYKIDKDRMYVTVFGGDKSDNLDADMEAFQLWEKFVPNDRIIFGSKKDNFWEMGDSGPCGPCSEIHVDIRDNSERKKINGRDLVNNDHPQVIEIWNLVFIQFNRQANGQLNPLSSKHVDTGMGFERLNMVLQNKKSNYDTDVFQPLIQGIAQMSEVEYGKNEQQDIAIRVIADHLRAICFAIADGQLPSNTGAGYVIRRILRRAVRYGYTFLNFDEPFINKLVPILISQMGEQFVELIKQKELIINVIHEEEASFLRTLSQGVQKFENYIKHNDNKIIKGEFAFELYDTYGFPIDLTCLMASENGFEVDMENFYKGLKEQKERSRKAAIFETTDWIDVINTNTESNFVGYDNISIESTIIKYRKVKQKDKDLFQIVFLNTPFYAESGGQMGDKGTIENEFEKIDVIDTKKENNLIIHITNKLPQQIDKSFKLNVDIENRQLTENNHSATHLLHSALRAVLGNHVEQKGSLVNKEKLRFDFSHFAKLSEQEIKQVENLVKQKIRENITLKEFRSIPIEEANKLGAMALFGEKYGDFVRVIQFDQNYSTELCGGTHVKTTSQIGNFKIISESAIAAGVRRIEACTNIIADEFLNEQVESLNQIKDYLKNPKDVLKSIKDLSENYEKSKKQIEIFNKEKVEDYADKLKKNVEIINNINFIYSSNSIDNHLIKDIAFRIKENMNNSFIFLFSISSDKVNIILAISDDLIKLKSLDASKIISNLAVEIGGNGGGQPSFATAGGKNIEGVKNVVNKLKDLILSI